MELSIRYISSGEARCERNGIAESGAVATINSKDYYFSIYGVRHPDANTIRWFLTVPANLIKACSKEEYPSLLETIRKEIEAKHQFCSGPEPLTLDPSSMHRDERPLSGNMNV